MHLLWAQMMGVRGSAARSLHPIGNRFPVRPIVMRIRAAHGCSQQYRSDSSDHLHSLCGLVSWNDAEPLGVFLLSTQIHTRPVRRSKSYADGSTQRCNALLEPSNGQAGLHDKFEEFARGFDKHDESGDAKIPPGKSPSPCAKGVERWQRRQIEQRDDRAIFKKLRRAANPGERWLKNSHVRGMFPNA